MDQMEKNQEVVVEEQSVLENIIGVFIHPVQTMKSLTSYPEVMLPILFIVFFSNFSALLNYDLTLENYTEIYTKAYSPLGIDVSEMMPVIFIGTQVAVTVGVLIQWLLFSFIISLAIKIMKGKGGYKKILSITGYAFLVKGLSIIILSIIYRVTGVLDYETVFSLGHFFQNSSVSPVVIGILQTVSLFRIWEYVVVAIGVSALTGFSKLKSAIAILIPYLIFVANTAFSVTGALSAGSNL